MTDMEVLVALTILFKHINKDLFYIFKMYLQFKLCYI